MTGKAQLLGAALGIAAGSMLVACGSSSDETERRQHATQEQSLRDARSRAELAAGLTGKSGGEKATSNNGTSASSPTAGFTSKSGDENAASKKIGDVVNFEDSDWVVLEAKDVGNTVDSNNRFQKGAKSGEGKFIRVKFSIKNKGKKEQRLYLKPKLIDGKGREFSHYEYEGFYVPKGATALGLEKIPVGLKKEFWSVYEVPKDAKNLMFETRALAVRGDKMLVALGL